MKRFVIIAVAMAALSSTNVFASEYGDCKARVIARFGVSVLTNDVLGMLGAVHDQGDCNKYLASLDAKERETIIAWNTELEQLRMRSARTGISPF
jgi:hypothetical protein